MIMSNKFAVAAHVLALLAIEKRSLSSTYIANSVNTNPVVIRRILGTLVQAGFVKTQLGTVGGATLARPVEEINLLAVHQAVEHGEVFAAHTHQPSLYCPCGSNIQPVLSGVFQQVESAIEKTLREVTLAQVVQDIKARLAAAGSLTP